MPKKSTAKTGKKIDSGVLRKVPAARAKITKPGSEVPGQFSWVDRKGTCTAIRATSAARLLDWEIVSAAL